MNSVRKRISKNDLGLTGGHQSGLLVPKTAVPLLPALAEDEPNPKMQLEIEDQDGRRSTATYTHYNNKMVGDGTRDEYRLTNMRAWFDANAPEVNDFVVFLQYAHDTLHVHHEAISPRGGIEAPDEFTGAPEGARSIQIVNAYERNERNRRAVLQRLGYRCQACDVLLEESYGQIAKGYAHVHHTKPISTVGDAYVPNLEEDFAVLCPNCHAIAHRRSPPLTVAQVRAAFRKGGRT